VQHLLHYSNAERLRFGLTELSLNDELSKAAQYHAEDMAGNQYFSHTGCSDGSSAADRVVSLTHYRYTSVAENLHFRTPDNDPFEVIRGWMNSPGHRKNMLNGAYSDVGFGYAVVGDEHYYVQVFGTPLRSPLVRGVDIPDYMLQRTNQIRRDRSLPQLAWSQELTSVAQIHAEDLLVSGKLSDVRSDGTSIFSWRRSRPYQGGGTAVSFYRQEPFSDPERVLQQWLKNNPCYILDGRYSEVGVGYATDETQHCYVQLFYGSYGKAQNSPRNYLQRQ